MKNKQNKTVVPFLKWAGGKTQLLSEIKRYYPFADSSIYKYAEPFIGGGAVLFDILNKFDLKEVYISDINPALINTYKALQNDAPALIDLLMRMQEDFLPLSSEERCAYFLERRAEFNELSSKQLFNTQHATLFVFLNKTCFNGLYRVNKNGLFNVSLGRYKSPIICNAENLLEASHKLQKVRIVCADYRKSSRFIDKHTFVYFDPPYRPLTKSANFTSYTEFKFQDKQQKELASFVRKLDRKGAKIVISNSDPKNTDQDDNFFDDLYRAFSIKRVNASRIINSNKHGRGKIKELLISNFELNEA